MVINSVRSFPNILARHAKQIEDFKRSNSAENELVILRKKQTFEMTTYHFITRLFKSKGDNDTFGYIPISQSLFELKNAPDVKLTCEIMMIKPFTNLKAFQEENIKIYFSAIKNLPYFYDMMVYSPLPVIVFPIDSLKAVRKFISLCYNCKNATDESVLVFEMGPYEVILMEPFVAFNFGLNDEATEIIRTGDICSFFFGFIYQRH